MLCTVTKYSIFEENDFKVHYRFTQYPNLSFHDFEIERTNDKSVFVDFLLAEEMNYKSIVTVYREARQHYL